MRLGLIINPLAGLGGSVALKGSDGVAAQAQALGAQPRAEQRCAVALQALLAFREQLEFCAFAGPLGGDLLTRMGFKVRLLGEAHGALTTAADSQAALHALQEVGCALILFAGGDGTARDLCAVARPEQPLLGIPAGVKIHSGVYAVSPQAAGELAARLVQGGLVQLIQGEVRDIDEAGLRQGLLGSRYFGELCVPQAGGFVQQVKQGGLESEELVLDELAQWLEEDWQPNVRYVFGPGSTLQGLARNLGLDTTLLGVDVIENGQVLARDLTEAQLFELVESHPALLLLSVIGGQGHILGRGNQQISPRVVRAIGLDQLRVVATKRKLTSLQGRPLLVDSGDPQLDGDFASALKVWAGYREELLYPLSGAGLSPAPNQA